MRWVASSRANRRRIIWARIVAQLAVVLALLVLPAQAWAATYYVSKSGSDANSCATAQSTTQSNQKLTIGAGLACLTSAGDTLTIHAGTYVENNLDAGTAANGSDMTTGAVRVQAATGETVWIKPNSGAAWVLRFNVVSYQIWTGINLDGANLTTGADGNLILNAGSHIRFQNSENTSAWWSGIVVSQSNGFGTYYEFLNLNIHDGGRCAGGCAAAHGIYFSAVSGTTPGQNTHHLFQTNTVSGFNALSNDSCVQAYGDSSQQDRLGGITIDRNLLSGCGVGSFLSNATTFPIVFTNNKVIDNAGSGVVLFQYLDAPQIYNNTIDGNGDWGIEVGNNWTTTNALIKNNAITSNTGGPVKVFNSDPTSYATIDHNGFNGNGNSNAILDQNSLTTPTNTVTSAPGYTNQGANNFTISNTSAYYNAGTTLASVTTDFLGLARPQSSSYDIGAYEADVPDTDDCAPPVVSGSWTLLGCPGAQTTSTSGNAVTTAINSTGADFAACAVASDVTQTAPTFSDSKSNTWTLVGTAPTINYGRSQLYFSRLASVGSGHTWTVNAGGLDSYVSVRCVVFSGSKASPLDASATGGTVSSGMTVAATSLTRLQTKELVVTGIETDVLAGATTVTATGFTVYQAPVTTTAFGVGIGWATYPDVGSVNPTWTWPTSMDAAATGASFLASDSAGAANPQGSRFRRH